MDYAKLNNGKRYNEGKVLFLTFNIYFHFEWLCLFYESSKMAKNGKSVRGSQPGPLFLKASKNNNNDLIVPKIFLPRFITLKTFNWDFW